MVSRNDCCAFLTLSCPISVVVKASDRVLARRRAEQPHEEYRIMKKLGDANAGRGHRNVLRVYADAKTADFYWSVLEFGGKGDLYGIVEQHRVLPVERAVGYFRQLVDGVGFLHDQGVCHLDLSLEVVDVHDTLKIADFGELQCFVMVLC